MLIETLEAEEARVLGALLEKSLATPDYYPMTLNALRTACNQKSSREPVTDYDDATVARALTGLKRKCLVTFIPYGSKGDFKYRHFLEDVRFNLRKGDLAVLAVLLLRGAQTLNEVRTRAASLHPIATNEEAEALLQGLAARTEPLAELLPKRPGWKEPRWRDTVRAEAAEPETEGAGVAEDAASAEAGEAPRSAAAGAPGGRTSGPGSGSGDEVADLRREVAELKASLAELRAVVEGLREALGA